MKRLMITLCALVLIPFVLGESTFMDDQDDFFIMADIVPTPVVTPVFPGGGGGYVAPECANDSDCGLGEFCFENKCYVYECDSDADCNDTKTCWMNRCVKLFDMKIIEVSSPIYPGEFFNFTYFLKGVAEIHGDVTVRFWLEQNGTIVTEGFDTIYMADFEEKTESTELFLPASILPGAYNFYAEVNYDSYYARALRVIEVEGIPGEVEEPGFLTGQVVLNVGETIKANAYFILVVLGILVLFGIIYWERREIGKALEPEARWIKRHKLSIGTFLFFVVLAGVLFYADRADILKLSPLEMSLVKYLYVAGLVAILVVVLARARIRNMFGHFWNFVKSLFARKQGLEVREKVKVKPVEAVKVRPKVAKVKPKAVVVKPSIKKIDKKIRKLEKKARKIEAGDKKADKKVKKVGVFKAMRGKKIKLEEGVELRKKKESLKPIVEKWRKKGYDTESLNEKPEKLKQGRMAALIEKWRKKGYDTGSITESTFRKGSSQHSKNTERGSEKNE